MNLYFATNKGETCNKHSLIKVSKGFDDKSRRYYVLNIFHFASDKVIFLNYSEKKKKFIDKIT